MVVVNDSIKLNELCVHSSQLRYLMRCKFHFCAVRFNVETHNKIDYVLVLVLFEIKFLTKIFKHGQTFYKPFFRIQSL